MSDDKHHPSYPYTPHDYAEDHHKGYCGGPDSCDHCDDEVDAQTRNVPFDDGLTCDHCGGMGAFDLYGDLLCARCLADGMVR